jgi:hypothetical protein
MSDTPITTSVDSPDTLPERGYTVDQLSNYVMRQLGWPTWNVELTKQQILDCIQDALQKYSVWCPCVRVAALKLERGRFRYLEDEDVGQGVVNVEFVEPNPVPTEIFYGNLINPAPLFRTGLDEYNSFLLWRKTWQRVTSIKPDWLYDEYERALYIHNPIERYKASVYIYASWRFTERLSAQGSMWVKEFALERARHLHGETMAKFGGAIPGPMKDLQLDQARRDKAEVRLKELLEELKGMQTSTPISID